MTKNQFIKKVEGARNAYIKAQSLENALFEELDIAFNGLDLEDCESNACNASNVKEAIMCYLHYEEYDPDRIWDEIMEAKSQ